MTHPFPLPHESHNSRQEFLALHNNFKSVVETIKEAGSFWKCRHADCPNVLTLWERVVCPSIPYLVLFGACRGKVGRVTDSHRMLPTCMVYCTYGGDVGRGWTTEPRTWRFRAHLKHPTVQWKNELYWESDPKAHSYWAHHSLAFFTETAGNVGLTPAFQHLPECSSAPGQ